MLERMGEMPEKQEEQTNEGGQAPDTKPADDSEGKVTLDQQVVDRWTAQRKAGAEENTKLKAQLEEFERAKLTETERLQKDVEKYKSEAESASSKLTYLNQKSNISDLLANEGVVSTKVANIILGDYPNVDLSDPELATPVVRQFKKDNPAFFTQAAPGVVTPEKVSETPATTSVPPGKQTALQALDALDREGINKSSPQWVAAYGELSAEDRMARMKGLMEPNT